MQWHHKSLCVPFSFIDVRRVSSAYVVLTISGRTIRKEAQASPEPAAEAEAAIDDFLRTILAIDPQIAVAAAAAAAAAMAVA
eukprot:68203-Pelagomonas_calceolata.AAC.4